MKGRIENKGLIVNGKVVLTKGRMWERKKEKVCALQRTDKTDQIFMT